MARWAPAFQARASWPAERIATEREKRLRQVLGHAKSQSPWHAKRLAHIDAETFTEADLARIPPMTKSDLMENFDQIITDPRLSRAVIETHLVKIDRDPGCNAYLLDRFHAIASSGSSGPRALFAYDWNGWTIAGLSLTRTRAIGLDSSTDQRGSRIVSITADAPSHFSFSIMRTFLPWVTMVPATLPLNSLVGRLNELQPNWIGGYPSVLYQLCLEADAGRLHVRPSIFTSSGEPLSADVRNALMRTFSAEVADSWACSEAGALGQSCGKGPGLHLNDDIAIVEPVDDEGAPVGAETPSKNVLVTNLFNLLLPLIRYEITDTVTFLDSSHPCVCGSQFRKIAPVHGRSSDVFVYPNGVLIYTWSFESILERDSSVIDHLAFQTAAGVRILVSTVAGFDAAVTANRIATVLEAHGLRDPKVTIEVTPSLPRGATGKLIRVIPLRPNG